MYLMIFEDNSFWVEKQLDEGAIASSERGVLTIINLETLEFHVEGNVWQKIPEK